MKKVINSPKAPAPIGPYSQAVKVNEMLYLSGQIALNAETGALVDSSIQDETDQVMKNIGYVLAEAGLDFTHIIKCSIFLKDMDNFNAVNQVYGSYFSSDFPSRECVQVAKLPKDVNVEITAIAAF
ncbi:MAG: RidA family protein [Flavobacteriales bacterium]